MPKLNLGCGTELIPGFINLDIRPLSGVDIVCDARKLDFEDNYFDEILANDLLEHFPRMDTLSILTEWNRVLKSGGKFILRVPDLDKIFFSYDIGLIPSEEAIRRIFGNQDYLENFHKTIFTESALKLLLEKADFDVIQVINFIARESTNIIVEAIKK